MTQNCGRGKTAQREFPVQGFWHQCCQLAHNSTKMLKICHKIFFLAEENLQTILNQYVALARFAAFILKLVENPARVWQQCVWPK